MKTLAIISLGSELTQGFTLNTNAHYLAQKACTLGYEVTLQLTIPDEGTLFHTFAKSIILQKTDCLIITGGLGPTADDKTRQFLADLANVPLEFSLEADNSIRAYFKKIAWAYDESNKSQSYIPKGSQFLENPVGTAPGIKEQVQSTTIWAIPGVPHEMKAMFQLHIEPFLALNAGEKYYSKELLFRNLNEIELQALLNTLNFNDVSWSSLPETDGIRFRLYGQNESSVKNAFETFKSALFSSKAIIITESNKTLIETLLEKLKEQNKRLCTAESCTGGLIASEIVRIPGSSAVFDGGIVSYSNTIKNQVLGVEQTLLDTYGAVSSEVVSQMATCALQKFNADYALATSGIAGPDGGTAEKPVGLVWFSIAQKNGPSTTFYRNFHGSRTEIREKSVFCILETLFQIITQNNTCTFVH